MFFALAIATSSIGIAAQGGVNLKPLQDENFDETAESQLTSLRGQDCSVTSFLLNDYAQTTDKAYFVFSLSQPNKSKIYSLNSNNKMKLENNKLLRNSGLI